MFAVRYNLWNLGSLFFLGLGIVLPLIVAALFVARRLAPDTKVRIGRCPWTSSAPWWPPLPWLSSSCLSPWRFTPSLLVALIGSLVLFAATVLARFIPFFAGDFLDRAEVPGPRHGARIGRSRAKPQAPRHRRHRSAAAKPADAGRHGRAARQAAGRYCCAARIPAGRSASGRTRRRATGGVATPALPGTAGCRNRRQCPGTGAPAAGRRGRRPPVHGPPPTPPAAPQRPRKRDRRRRAFRHSFRSRASTRRPEPASPAAPLPETQLDGVPVAGAASTPKRTLGRLHRLMSASPAAPV